MSVYCTTCQWITHIFVINLLAESSGSNEKTKRLLLFTVYIYSWDWGWCNSFKHVCIVSDVYGNVLGVHFNEL